MGAGERGRRVKAGGLDGLEGWRVFWSGGWVSGGLGLRAGTGRLSVPHKCIYMGRARCGGWQIGYTRL